MNPLVMYIGAVILFVSLVLFGAISQERAVCKSYELIGGYEIKYEAFTGCWVKMPDGWIRSDDNKTQKK